MHTDNSIQKGPKPTDPVEIREFYVLLYKAGILLMSDTQEFRGSRNMDKSASMRDI